MSIFSGLFGGGNASGAESDLAGISSAAEGYASQAAALAPQFEGASSNIATEAGQIYGPAIDQYTAGASGQVTPDQQTDIDQTLQQMNLATSGTYANLGLGDSTMKTQDINANTQKSLAQKQQFASLDEQLGLSGLSTANQYNTTSLQALVDALSSYTGAGNILGVASGASSAEGNIANAQTQQQLNLLTSLGKALGGGNNYSGSGYSYSYSGGAGTG